MPKLKKLSKTDLQSLGSLVEEQELLSETVKVGSINLTLIQHSPMVVYDFMTLLTRTLTKSKEMEEIVIKFFPQLTPDVYAALSYTSLMEVLGHIATSILTRGEKQNLQENISAKEESLRDGLEIENE